MEPNEVTPEEKQAQVEQEFKEKFKKDDGSYDVDAMARAFYYKDSKLRATNFEAKERRLQNEEYVKELEEKAADLKKIKEAELLEQSKYEELLNNKNKEIEQYQNDLKELEFLKQFKTDYEEKRAKELDSKLSQLAKDQREIFDAAFADMEGNVEKKMTLINKLTTTKKEVSSIPGAGKVSHSDTIDNSREGLMRLKETNPELYKAKLREKVRSSIKI